MEMVNKSLLRPEESLHVERRMQYSVWPLMMKLACREREKKEVLPMAFIDLTEEENGCIRLEGSFDQIGAGEKGSFFVKYVGNRMPHAQKPQVREALFFRKAPGEEIRFFRYSFSRDAEGGRRAELLDYGWEKRAEDACGSPPVYGRVHPSSEALLPGVMEGISFLSRKKTESLRLCP